MSPSFVNMLLKTLLVNVDFPTPEFPAKAVILFFKKGIIFSASFAFLATISTTLYPIDL